MKISSHNWHELNIQELSAVTHTAQQTNDKTIQQIANQLQEAFADASPTAFLARSDQ